MFYFFSIFFNCKNINRIVFLDFYIGLKKGLLNFDHLSGSYKQIKMDKIYVYIKTFRILETQN